MTTRAYDVEAFERLRSASDQIRTISDPAAPGHSPVSQESRPSVDVAANRNALEPFAKGDSNLVVTPEGQAIAAESPEFRKFRETHPEEAAKFQQLTHMMRTFYSSDYPMFRERMSRRQKTPSIPPIPANPVRFREQGK